MRSHIVLVLFFSFAFLSACQRHEKVNQSVPAPVVLTTDDSATARPIDLEKEISGTFDGLVSDFESKDRVIWQKPDLVINLLGDLQNKTIADIGAGTGYFAFRLIPKAEKVIAIDIDKRFITFMDSIRVRLSEPAQKRFETRLTKPENPQLAPNEVDMVMLVDTYGYIQRRDKYLNHIKRGLKTGGEILIIDFKKENLPADVAGSFTISLSTVVRELEAAGFVIKKVDNVSLDYQYIISAAKGL